MSRPVIQGHRGGGIHHTHSSNPTASTDKERYQTGPCKTPVFWRLPRLGKPLVLQRSGLDSNFLMFSQWFWEVREGPNGCFEKQPHHLLSSAVARYFGLTLFGGGALRLPMVRFECRPRILRYSLRLPRSPKRSILAGLLKFLAVGCGLNDISPSAITSGT